VSQDKGVIRCRDLKPCTKEEIIQELSPQCVTDSHNITVLESGIKRQINTFILPFNSPTPPKYRPIMIGCYERVKVEMYIPNPLRCYNCQLFGHGKNNCCYGRMLAD